jgi:hypothetical protein
MPLGRGSALGTYGLRRQVPNLFSSREGAASKPPFLSYSAPKISCKPVTVSHLNVIFLKKMKINADTIEINSF